MSPRQVFKAFAKVNLGLEVLGRRADGYHDVRTVLQTIGLADTLEVFPAREGIAFTCSDPSLPTGEDNLVVKAARLVQREFGVRAGARLSLTKRIPSQAGLGGGSSDAAVALLATARLWKVEPDRQRLLKLAAGLGSDVPFFLCGGTALGVGRGEEVYPLPDGPSAHLVVAWPSCGMSTAVAYQLLENRLTAPREPHTIQTIVGDVVRGRLSERHLFNRFEEVAALSETAREAEAVRRTLFAVGATRALMAGSGSAWVGFFPGRAAALAGAKAMAHRGFGAAATATLTRASYWERVLPDPGKEWLP